MGLESRTRAKSAVEGGCVSVNGEVCRRVSTQVGDGDTVEITSPMMRYVGRGGLKLEEALSGFGIDPRGALAVDIGSSTGGFTDCLLQHGAERILAVDTGHGQLHPKLKDDPRVISMEGTDVRTLDRQLVENTLGGMPDIIASDVSFISILKIAPAVSTFSDKNTKIILLLKPQFETERSGIGKNGIVRDIRVHRRVAERVISGLLELGIVTLDMMPSPIRGGDGNIEYLLLCKNSVDLSDKMVDNYRIRRETDRAFGLREEK